MQGGQHPILATQVGGSPQAPGGRPWLGPVTAQGQPLVGSWQSDTCCTWTNEPGRNGEKGVPAGKDRFCQDVPRLGCLVPNPLVPTGVCLAASLVSPIGSELRGGRPGLAVNPTPHTHQKQNGQNPLDTARQPEPSGDSATGPSSAHLSGRPVRPLPPALISGGLGTGADFSASPEPSNPVAAGTRQRAANRSTAQRGPGWPFPAGTYDTLVCPGACLLPCRAPGVRGRLDCSRSADDTGSADVRAPRCAPATSARRRGERGAGPPPEPDPRLGRSGPLRPVTPFPFLREPPQPRPQPDPCRGLSARVDPSTCPEVCVPRAGRGGSGGPRNAESVSRPASQSNGLGTSGGQPAGPRLLGTSQPGCPAASLRPSPPGGNSRSPQRSGSRGRREVCREL